MNRSTFQSMPLDDLWALHEKIGLLLSARLEDACCWRGWTNCMVRLEFP